MGSREVEYERAGGLVLAADQLKALGVGGDAGVSLTVCGSAVIQRKL